MAHGSIDVAIVWGPLAGFIAAQAAQPLRIEPVQPQVDAGWPMAYAISIGVRPDEPELLQQLNGVLRAEHASIAALLRAYHVPAVASADNVPAERISAR